MDNLFGEGTVVGYCTNVHAGASWAEMQSNLDRYAVAVKKRVSPDAPMGIGLWLSAQSAREVLEEDGLGRLKDYLAERGLSVFTLNGFPYGDFHQEVVKHEVYQPDWGEKDRFDYTLQLVSILNELIPDPGEGSISTLPVGWGGGKTGATRTDIEKAVSALVHLSQRLQLHESETGKLIHVDLEPEPGCYLGSSEEVVALFKEGLFRKGDEETIRRYLRVCHDVCHSAVMFEDQKEVLDRYREAGIQIGKVQVSSALAVDFDSLDEEGGREAFAQLRSFEEVRFLHQTVVRGENGRTDFHEDLPQALDTISAQGRPRGEWRVHFHVPIFLESAGILGVTQDQILEGLPLLSKFGVKHFEVETYAWNVLPDPLRSEDLAEGIARELEWLASRAVA